MEPGIKSLYQESELKGPEVVVRVMLGIGATKSHKSGSIAIAVGNHCWRQAKVIEKRDQEMPRKRYPSYTKGGGSEGRAILEILGLLRLNQCSAS